VRRGPGVVAVRENAREPLVVRRDRNLHPVAQASTNASVACACSPCSPRSVTGMPTTIRSGISRSTIRSSDSRPASVPAFSTMHTGRASVPVGSDTATPVRAAP